MDLVDALLLAGWAVGAVALTAWALAPDRSRLGWAAAWAAWMGLGFNLVAWRSGHWSPLAATGCLLLGGLAVALFILAAKAYELQGATWRASGRRATFWYPFDVWFRKRDDQPD